MKTTISILLLILISSLVEAQETVHFGGYDGQEVKTIFTKEKRDGFYGSFSMGYSPIDNKDGFTVSARGCWIMDHFFSFGMGGTAFINDIDRFPRDYYVNDEAVNANSLAGGYGGLILEPIIFPLFPVHVSFPVLVGVGGISDYLDYDYYSSYSSISDFFWVVEPSVELEVNFTKWLRIALYGTYRFTSDIDIEGVSKNALKSYSAGITFKMGLF
jgi:hypothetical protein